MNRYLSALKEVFSVFKEAHNQQAVDREIGLLWDRQTVDYIYFLLKEVIDEGVEP